MIDFNGFRVFYTVAKYKSITKAAEKLHVSQTVVTSILKKLQKSLHIALFKKDIAGLSLTEHGEKLFLYAEQLFLAEGKIESFLSTIQVKKTHTFTIGIPSLYEEFDKAHILSCFKEQNIDFSVQSANSKKLLDMLHNREIDIAIAGDLRKHHHGSCIASYYKKHEVKLIIPKGHRLYGKEYFSPHDIHFEKVMLKEKGSAVRKAVDEYCKNHDIKILTVAELEKLDALLSACLFEKCLTFIPDMVADALLINNSSFSVASPKNSSINFEMFYMTRNADDYPLDLWTKISKCINKKEEDYQ